MWWLDCFDKGSFVTEAVLNNNNKKKLFDFVWCKIILLKENRQLNNQIKHINTKNKYIDIYKKKYEKIQITSRTLPKHPSHWACKVQSEWI